MKDLWNQRYSSEEYKYGKEPNLFFQKELKKIEPGRILLIGEGEGRNAVYAATLGWIVDAVDFSETGKTKALKLAEEVGVKINYEIKDLSQYEPTIDTYDAIGVIFVHLEEKIRKPLFDKLIKSLKKNGKIILECFEKEQLKFSSGGPKDSELLYSLEDIVNDFIDLDFEKLSKEIVLLKEGMGHNGEGVVIQFLGVKK